MIYRRTNRRRGARQICDVCVMTDRPRVSKRAEHSEMEYLSRGRSLAPRAARNLPREAASTLWRFMILLVPVREKERGRRAAAVNEQNVDEVSDISLHETVREQTGCAHLRL